jgi:hypothetical protein
MLSGPQGWSGCGGEEKKISSLPLPGLEPQSSSLQPSLYIDWAKPAYFSMCARACGHTRTRRTFCDQTTLAVQPANQPTDWQLTPTNSMQHSPSWEANSHSASQEIPHLLRNLKVHYHVHKSPSLILIISKMHPVHTFPSNFPEINSNIIFSPMPRSSKWSHPFRFSDQNFVYISHLSHACYMPYPSHPP